MKKLLALFVIVLVLAIGAATQTQALNKFLTYSLCDEPIKYRVDTVDPKFNLSREEFSKNINQAAEIWSEAANKNLFVYDPEGELSINLIYDERQTLTNKIGQLEDNLQTDKSSLNPKIEEYEKRSREFKKKVEELNSKVEEWNNKGGAPQDEYKKITQEQQALQNEADQLNAMAQSLNVSTREYNSQVSQLNNTIKNFNAALEERPEEGIYKGPENKIEIYFNINKDELVHTIAHELGHALGLEHVTNSKAIMYSKTNQSLIPTEDDLLILNDLCRERSMFEFIQSYILQISLKFKQVN